MALSSNRAWGPIAESYKNIFCSAYMPIDEGRFLYEHTILRKETLYKTCTGGVLVPIRDPLRECNLAFADGEVLPRNSNNFEVWYRRLPIHKLFLQGKKLRFITRLQTMNNQISHLFTLTGMLIVNSVRKMTVKRMKRIQW